MQLFICFFFLSFSYAAVSSKPFSTFSKLQLPPKALSPESTVFDAERKGPYVSVSDGRILKYEGPKLGFVDFATTSPNRTKELCDGTEDPELGPTCGRPLGLGFNYRTGELYIADSYLGLLVVGPKGGLAKQITNWAGGKAFLFTDGLDVDPHTGIVYFTDAGSIMRAGNLTRIILSGDLGSRLLKYDPKTQQVTVLLTGLSGAAGVAVSRSGRFLLVAEFIGSKIIKYWLNGPKANSSEVLIKLPGRHPDNITRNKRGDFWVAASIVKLQQPKLDVVAFGLRINKRGEVVTKLDLGQQYPAATISEVHEFNGALFISSAFPVDFVGVCRVLWTETIYNFFLDFDDVLK